MTVFSRGAELLNATRAALNVRAQSEQFAFVSRPRRAHPIDRLDHAPVAIEQVVGQRDNAQVGLRMRGCLAQREGDLRLAPRALSIQSTVKAVAVERLMPAQQWISMGRLRSQVLGECDDLAHVLFIGRRVLGQGVHDIVHAEPQMPMCRNPVGRRMSSLGSSSVIRCDGLSRSAASGT